MAYIYQTIFDIPSEEADQMQIGKSLGLSMSYLKALLPDEPGFVNTRAMVLLKQNKNTHLVFESSWADWDSLQAHLKNSPVLEEKIFPKFDLKVKLTTLTTNIYKEV